MSIIYAESKIKEVEDEEEEKEEKVLVDRFLFES